MSYGSQVSSLRDSPLTCAPGESQYELAYGAQGTRVAIVASEPITGSPSDWVAVPKNTALVISREKKEDGFVNIMQAPLDAYGQLRCHEEVSRYLKDIIML